MLVHVCNTHTHMPILSMCVFTGRFIFMNFLFWLQQNIVGSKPLQDIDVTTMSSAEVIHEIFDSIQREVVDEVNIPLEKLGEPLYMGTHRNKLSAGRPSLAFAIR